MMDDLSVVPNDLRQDIGTVLEILVHQATSETRMTTLCCVILIGAHAMMLAAAKNKSPMRARHDERAAKLIEELIAILRQNIPDLWAKEIHRLIKATMTRALMTSAIKGP